MANNVLNVLSNEYRNNLDEIDELVASLKRSGASRSERRAILRTASRQNKLSAKAQEKAQEQAYEYYKQVIDKDMVYFFTMLGLTMIEDYHWQEKDTDHGQISSLFDRLQAKMRKYEETDLDKLVDKFYELSEIKLVSNQQEYDEEYKKD